jgi:hypothetical protein
MMLIMKRKFIVIFCIFAGIQSFALAQSFSISKFNSTSPSNQSIIYALPKTGLNVTFELTKTTLKRGIYADYAEKLLGITNVPLKDYERWTIDDTKLSPVNEPDPDHYYGLTFKTMPENLQSLFSMNQNGIILELSNIWKRNYLASGKESTEPLVTDPFFIDDPIKEKVDTLYKTIITDSAVTRIPVFKKQTLIKTFEEMAKDAAHELIKTRKHRIKLIRGEYEFHPDGAAVKVMVEEMLELEQYYLSLFLGVKNEEKLTQTFVVFPSADLVPSKIGSFSSQKGITESASGSNIISVQFSKENAPAAPNITTDKQEQNVLYFRVPSTLKVSLFIDQNEKIQTRIPFYQFGSIQSIMFKK